MKAIDEQLGLLVEPLEELCRKAGRAIAEVYQSSEALVVEQKPDSSPLTVADQLAHDILYDGLSAIAPQWPVLSEEQPAPSLSVRQQWHRYWLVDPLDGTREFIDRTGEFTINVALIEAGCPVLGVVYLPLEEVAYIGAPSLGLAVKAKTSGRQDLPVNKSDRGSQIRVLTSSRHNSDRLKACMQHLEAHFDAVKWLRAGSAIKFCRLAEGAGDFYPRYSPCSEWDTAAGQAVLEAAGGGLVGLDFKPLRYNQRASLINPPFYALANRQWDWQSLLAGL